MKSEFAAVHSWEEVLSQPRVDPEREYARREKYSGKNTAVTDTGLEQSAIPGTNPLKVVFKPNLKPHKRILARAARAFFGMRLEKILGHGGYERPRKDVGSQHCEDHCFRHGHKEIAGDTGEQEHGHKHDADVKGC